VAVKSNKPSLHLARVLRKIQVTHWGKGQLWDGTDEHPTYCILGLVELTGDMEPQFEEEDEVFCRYPTLTDYLDTAVAVERIKGYNPGDFEGEDDGAWGEGEVIDFNDYSDTTREDIIRVVRRAISLAKKDGQ
jgi:hypothetical protein